MRSVAIFGGTFNPIHYGHLAAAEEIRTRLGLDKVIFVPSGTPPHKEAEDLASPKQRCLMAEMAVVGNPSFEVSDYEAGKKGKTYSIDTVRHFREALGPEAALYFVIGADMLGELGSWRSLEEILGLCRFVVVQRPGFDVQRILDRQILSGPVPAGAELLDNLLIQETPMLDISSTQIRRRVKELKSIRYLVPESVEQYIHNQRLYV
jgi:nicotinate-nucleotide adenylyltransferase